MRDPHDVDFVRGERVRILQVVAARCQAHAGNSQGLQGSLCLGGRKVTKEPTASRSLTKLDGCGHGGTGREAAPRS
jgi:hypothetical protein